MSGYFQRPSLKRDTFQSPVKQPKSGLKVAFESRIGNKPTNIEKSIKSYNNYDLDSLSQQTENNEIYELQQPSTSFKARSSSTSLKSAFEKRQEITKMSSNISRTNSNRSAGDEYKHESIDLSLADDGSQKSLENFHPLGYHSIHRLSALNRQDGSDNLRRAYEARIGGTMRNLSRNSQADVVLENHANLIVSKMEQDDSLMEDTPDAEELRRTALRDMPQCLTIKRCVKVKLSKSVSQKSKKKPLNLYKTLKYRISMSIAKFKIDMKDLAYSFELWYGPLKKIEGNFGTGVTSFFKFLRWLFLVNFMIALLSVSFIVIPKSVYDLPEHTETSWMNILRDLFTGEGFLTDSIMYYGSYANGTINSNTVPYSMPHAYFFTMIVIYFVSLAVLGISAAKSYRRSFIETEGGLKNIYANKIFCGWDYNIATKDAAVLKSNAIYNELKELLSDFAWRNRKVPISLRIQTVIVQFFMNIFIFCLMVGLGYSIWYFLDKVLDENETRIIITPLFINSVMTFFPMFMSYLVKYEDYKNPKVTLYLTLARTFLLGVVTITVLVSYWIINNSNSSCWETSLAQEMYRMIIFDFFISVLFVAVIDLSLYGIYRLKKDSYLEFDIAWNTMQLLYNQTLFWVGLPVSPLLPVVVVIKLFLTWYIRQFIVLYLCKPSSKIWRAAQTTTWFLVMTFLSMMLICGLLGYIMAYIPVSKACGPFRNYEFMYEIAIKGVVQLQENSIIWSILLYFTRPGVIALIIIGLIAVVYCLKVKANAQKEIVDQCRNMLVWSAKDKEYYYSLISKVTKGQWQYNLQDKRYNPELYSPYLNTGNEKGDFSGTPVSNLHCLSSPSDSLLDQPSTSTMSYNLDNDDLYYSRYKKNS